MRPEILSLAGCLLLVGCAHSLIVVNAGIANKSAAAMGIGLTPETYCMALIASKLSVSFHQGKKYPEISAEQADFCHDVTAEEKH